MPNETLYPATQAARQKWLRLTQSEHLLFRPGRHAQLERGGLIVPEHIYAKWDDGYNKPVKNGVERQPLHVMFDLLSFLYTENPPARFVWLYGDPKAGKTFLARITAVHLCAALNVRGIYCNWAIKLQDIRNGFNNGDRTDLTAEQETDVLVLDDMGHERGTPWEVGHLYNLIEARSDKLLTIFTSNLHLTLARKGSDGNGGEITWPAYLKILGIPARKEDGIDGRLTADAARIRSRLQLDRYLLMQVHMARKETK